MIPKAARYPLFLLGLVTIIFGSLIANFAGLGLAAQVAFSVIGFALLILAVALR